MALLLPARVESLCSPNSWSQRGGRPSEKAGDAGKDARETGALQACRPKGTEKVNAHVAQHVTTVQHSATHRVASLCARREVGECPYSDRTLPSISGPKPSGVASNQNRGLVQDHHDHDQGGGGGGG